MREGAQSNLQFLFRATSTCHFSIWKSFNHQMCFWKPLVCMLACDWHLQEVFDVGVIVSFLLDERGAIQLTRTESARTRKTFTKKRRRWKVTGCEEPRGETWCRAACEAADWSGCRRSSSLASDHPTSSSWLSELCEGTQECARSRIHDLPSVHVIWQQFIDSTLHLLEQFDVAHDELLPVDKDHGHFLLHQQFALQQGFVKNLQIFPRVTHHVWLKPAV